MAFLIKNNYNKEKEKIIMSIIKAIVLAGFILLGRKVANYLEGKTDKVI